MTPTLDELTARIESMAPAARAKLLAEVGKSMARHIWMPLPGPQTMAYKSQADVVGYGGSAGGGKSDLAIGKALMRHHEVLIMRREATQLKGILRRMEQLLGSRDGYNGQDRRWSKAGPREVDIEFGSCPNLGDETKHQGNPHDLLVLDEATNFLESQVNFLLGWNRTVREGVHCQALMAFNPPTSIEGRWVVAFFAPWLDVRHDLYPTAPGVLRYCVTVPGDNESYHYVWVEDARPCVLIDGEIEYDFDPAEYRPEDIVVPQSRTFIPSRISDNPHLAKSGYMRVLQAMPEPLRSQLLYGDFQAGMTDDPWQVVPTAWVEAAMARWTPRSPRGEMLSMGCDVARGGKDNTIIATRHKAGESALWFDKLKVYPGKETPSGDEVAGLVVGARRDQAPVHIDVIGVGSSPYDTLARNGVDVYAVNVAIPSLETDKAGVLTFFNLRSQLWWQLREALDPENDTGICLPPDPELLKEACSATWKPSGRTVRVASRDEIIDAIGRSPDRATAVILALIDSPKRRKIEALGESQSPALEYNPYRDI